MRFDSPRSFTALRFAGIVLALSERSEASRVEVDLEGIAPSFPVCDAGVFLLDDKPVAWFDSVLHTSLTTLSEPQRQSRGESKWTPGESHPDLLLFRETRRLPTLDVRDWLPQVESNHRFDVQSVASCR